MNTYHLKMNVRTAQMIQLKVKSSSKIKERKRGLLRNFIFIKNRTTGSRNARNSIPTIQKSLAGREDNEIPLSHSSVSVSAISKKKSNGRRIYDKRQYSLFCETSVTKYDKHDIWSFISIVWLELHRL